MGMIFLLLLIVFGFAGWLTWFWLYAMFWCPHVKYREERRWQKQRQEHPAKAAAEDAAYRRYMAAHAVEHQTEYLRAIASAPFPPRTI